MRKQVTSIPIVSCLSPREAMKSLIWVPRSDSDEGHQLSNYFLTNPYADVVVK